IIPVSDKYGIGQVVFSPLAQGVLTGKYLNGIPENSRAANEDINIFVKHMLNDDVLNKVRQLDGLAKELDTTLPALVIARILREQSVARAIVGASRSEQIEANDEETKLKQSTEIIEKIDEILK